MNSRRGHELVIGLVGAIGVDMHRVISKLKRALELLAVGANEVARAFGGQYFEGDHDDGRDHEQETDSNAEMNRHVLEDLLARLKSRGWLSNTHSASDVQKLVERMRSEGLLNPFPRDNPDVKQRPSLRKSARILHGIEFIRAVHAEMAALMSMARRGVSAKDCTMYVTTFPCHECAKHIVASGIKRVVFIEPYPKSRVMDLFSDSVVVDEPRNIDKVQFTPFVGIAPRRYLDLFEAPQRKNADGSWVDWDSVCRQQKPRLGGAIWSYVDDEKELVTKLKKHLSLLAEQSKLKSLPQD